MGESDRHGLRWPPPSCSWGGRLVFTYDSFGRRVQSSIQLGSNPAQTVQYVYEGAQALGEIRSGQLSHRLITGLSLDETIARVALASGGGGNADPARSRHFLTDALNSVIAQMHASTSGGIANSYAYSPYGQSTTVGPDEIPTTPSSTPPEKTTRRACCSTAPDTTIRS